MLSLQRCSVNQASENNEMFDSLAPAKRILLGLLISTFFWTCLGLAIWSLDSVRSGRGTPEGRPVLCI
jgi:hypothetical protein